MNPKEVANIELLEMHSHYTSVSIRMPDKQDYIALMRRGIR